MSTRRALSRWPWPGVIGLACALPAAHFSRSALRDDARTACADLEQHLDPNLEQNWEEKPSLLPWFMSGGRVAVAQGLGAERHVCTAQNERVRGCPELKVFSGNANVELAGSVAKLLGTELSACKVGRFADGEVRVEVLESVRGKDVYVIQPTSPPVNEHLIELLLLVSTLRHASAKRVTVICPYFGYMRSAGIPTPQLARKVKRMLSRRDTRSRTVSNRVESEEKHMVHANTTTSNLAAADVAKMLEVVGIDRIVTFDLQAPGQGQAEGFFMDAQVEPLLAEDNVVEELVDKLQLKERVKEAQLVVAAPKTGCLTIAKNFRERLVDLLGDDSIGLATIIRTPTPDAGGKSKNSVDVVGNVKDKIVLLVNDVVDTGGPICRAVNAVKAEGAREVYAFASHAILGGESAERVQASELEKLVVLDTVPIPKEKRELCPKIETISIAPALSRLIGELHFVPK